MAAKELGIGVRVYTGWCPNSDMTVITTDPRTRIGTIVDGPVLPGKRFPPPYSFVTNGGTTTAWVVLFDNGVTFGAREEVLFPLDDGDDGEVQEEQVEDETTLA